MTELSRRLLGLAFVAVLVAAPLWAGTITVPDDHPTIQQAINAATSGDTIHVRAGTYYEHVTIAKALTLEGEDRATTVIDGGGSGKTVISSAGGVTIRGLTITGGGTAEGTIQDAGLVIQNASNNVVENCVITQNGLNGIYVHQSSNMTIRGCEISFNNATTSYKGAIHFRYSSNATIEGNEIHSNAGNGYCGRSGSNANILRDNWFHDNGEQAVHIGHSSGLTVSDNLMESNQHGVVFDGGSSGTLVTQNVIRLNTGAAIRPYFYATGFTVVENLIEENAIGVRLDGRQGGQTYYHNDIIGNAEQVEFVNGFATNTWDSGYPGGGNYWSDYTGADAFSGPGQDVPGADDLGDTPHALSLYDPGSGDRDRYPLMSPRSGPTNAPPTADAGHDQSIHAGDEVFLNGSASFDDNTASADLFYAWSFTQLPEGSEAVLDGAETPTPRFVADLPATYVVQLVVTDEGELESTPDEVLISAENLPPTANAGDDQLAVTGTTVYLDGWASSDPESDPLGFAWSIDVSPAGSAAVLIAADTATPSLVPDLEGLYRVGLIVSDLIGPGTPDAVEITATTAEDYAEIKTQASAETVEELSPGQITTKGNQQAYLNFLSQAMLAIQEEDLDSAIHKLGQAIGRADGCVLRGVADGNGPGRDWITDCVMQPEVYWLLQDALQALVAVEP